MKIRLLPSISAVAIAMALANSNAAFAHEPEQPHEPHGLTRAEVTAEYLAARAAGTLPPSGDNYPGDPYFKSTKSRAEVHEETLAAIARGEVAVGEQYPAFTSPVSGKTRAQVQQELAEAKRTHTLLNDQMVAY